MLWEHLYLSVYGEYVETSKSPRSPSADWYPERKVTLFMGGSRKEEYEKKEEEEKERKEKEPIDWKSRFKNPHGPPLPDPNPPATCERRVPLRIRLGPNSDSTKKTESEPNGSTCRICRHFLDVSKAKTRSLPSYPESHVATPGC